MINKSISPVLLSGFALSEIVYFSIVLNTGKYNNLPKIVYLLYFSLLSKSIRSFTSTLQNSNLTLQMI